MSCWYPTNAHLDITCCRTTPMVTSSRFISCSSSRYNGLVHALHQGHDDNISRQKFQSSVPNHGKPWRPWIENHKSKSMEWIRHTLYTNFQSIRWRYSLVSILLISRVQGSTRKQSARLSSLHHPPSPTCVGPDLYSIDFILAKPFQARLFSCTSPMQTRQSISALLPWRFCTLHEKF